MTSFAKTFTVGKIVIDGEFNFNSCQVSTDVKGGVGQTRNRYVYRIKSVEIPRERNKQRKHPVSNDELRTYRGLAGKLMDVRSGVPFPKQLL